MPLHLHLRPGGCVLIGAALVGADGPVRPCTKDADTPAARLPAAAQAGAFDGTPERRETAARLAEECAGATTPDAIRAAAPAAATAARSGDRQALLRQTCLLLHHEAAVLPR
jgi:hypothetical protein